MLPPVDVATESCMGKENREVNEYVSAHKFLLASEVRTERERIKNKFERNSSLLSLTPPSRFAWLTRDTQNGIFPLGLSPIPFRLQSVIGTK